MMARESDGVNRADGEEEIADGGGLREAEPEAEMAIEVAA
jgi:hypothetical protein